jgi:NADPH-dependent 2,4-dienoyl-CoA reductase/sulfur reductase-like enzyme
MNKLVVVGASLAGLRAVEAARKTGFAGEIVLIGAEPHLPYDRPPLSKAYLDDGNDTVFRSTEYFRDELGVDLVFGRPATALDTSAKQVWIGDRGIDYDALVIATGARARTLPNLPALTGVHVLRTIDDARAVRAALESGSRTVVIGAGFIGSEIASSTRKRGLAVTIVEAMPTPLVRAVGESMGAQLSALHTAHGTDLRCGVGVSGLRGNGRVEAVVLDDGTEIPADLVVVGVGAAPAVDWLESSALSLDNGVVCDETLWTGVDGVYAAGDVANWHNPQFGRRMRLEHWTSAAEQGAIAARNALDPAAAKPYSTVPYFWSDWYDVRIQFAGTPVADEIEVVIDRPNLMVALYRTGEHVTGALTVNGQSKIMKYRGMIMRRASWQDALEFAVKGRVA